MHHTKPISGHTKRIPVGELKRILVLLSIEVNRFACHNLFSPELSSCVKMAAWFPEQAGSDLTYLVDQKNGD